jgi:hypothetical protein
MELPKNRIAEWRDVDRATFANEIVPRHRPAVLKGLVKNWPAVEAVSASPAAVCEYLAGFYRGAPVEAFVGAPEIGGRFFYRPDMAGFNFERKRARLTDFLGYLLSQMEVEGRPALYIGASPVQETLPGFERANSLNLIGDKPAVPRIWIGNDITVTTHFDLSDNIACVVAGRRRFVIFPPSELPNLYVGPLDHTMAGQPASMVSLHEPDFEKYPKFRQALDAAEVAELEPGDAIYIPSLWWHHVDSLDPFNILVNYWWDDAPADAGSPFEALAHGILTIGALPEARREEWRILFDHYVFRKNGDPAAHLAPEHRGILGTSTPQLRARMKQFLMNALSRR